MISDSKDASSLPALLTIDVGNTSTAICIAQDGELRDRQTIPTSKTRQIEAALKVAWDALELLDRHVVCGSVVPEALAHLKRFAVNELDTGLSCIRDDVPLAIKLAVDEPDRVGVDRVCTATAAYMEAAAACAIADFGTAIKIDCVDQDGTFLGGTIAPGLDLSAWILHEATAALPLVRLNAPADSGIGTNTESAIETGILLGAIGGLREIVERFATKLGQWPKLVLTGGQADLIAKHCKFVDAVRPNLCLEGIAATYLKYIYDHEHQ
jgi:type III pantothenate kinase